MLIFMVLQDSSVLLLQDKQVFLRHILKKMNVLT